MSYNGSGTFQINTAGQPVVSGTTISSTAFNALTADLATGLSTAITKDGQTTITANIPFAGNKITGLGAATAASDAARFDQIQSGAAAYITAAGTDTYTGTMVPTLAAYATGNQFSFIVPNTNTGASTLNIDGLGAKAITKNGTTALAAGDLVATRVVIVEYDGTRFQLINPAVSALSTALTSAHIFVGNVSNIATDVAMSGDVAIDNTGATTVSKIGGETISLADSFTTSGANALTLTTTGATNVTLPTSGTLLTNSLTSANFFVGDGSNVATGVAMSGDAALANTGAVTLATVNSNVGSFTNASITVNGKGLITAASSGSPAGWTVATPQAATSGNTVTFTGLTGAKVIHVSLQAVSTNGTGALTLQIGSGSLTATGYVGGAIQFDTSTPGAAGTNLSTSFVLEQVTIAANNYSGMLTLTLIDAANNVWSISGGVAANVAASSVRAGGVVFGYVALAGALDRVAVITADTFDGSGQIGVTWMA